MASVSDSISEYDDRIDLTPMLDCVLVLLLFLIIATTFEEDALFKVKVPQAKNAVVRTSNDAITLGITADGKYFMGKKIIPDRELYSELRREFTPAAASQKPKALVIKGDSRAPYHKAVMAIDTAQALKISEFSLVVGLPER